MSHWPPLTCAEVKAALNALGFSPEPRKGTSHEQWIKTTPERRYKVTVDCPKSPFSLTLIDAMAAQAGVSRQQLYQAADKKRKRNWLWR